MILFDKIIKFVRINVRFELSHPNFFIIFNFIEIYLLGYQ